MKATHVVLTGQIGFVSQAVMLRTMSYISHAGILLEDNRLIEASPIAREVVANKYVKPYWYQWHLLYPLDSLGERAQYRIAAKALSLVGKKYGFKEEGFGHLTGNHVDNPNRYVCFELVATATSPYITYPKPAYELVGRHMVKALASLRG